MTEVEIKKIARTKILTGTAALLAILVLLLLIGETRGDFANGILFFIELFANIHTVVILLILFGLSYLFAGYAAKEITIEKQHIILVSVKYVIVISAVISIYFSVVGFFKQNQPYFKTLETTITVYFLPLFTKIDITLLIVWLWATKKIKSIQA